MCRADQIPARALSRASSPHRVPLPARRRDRRPTAHPAHRESLGGSVRAYLGVHQGRRAPDGVLSIGPGVRPASRGRREDRHGVASTAATARDAPALSAGPSGGRRRSSSAPTAARRGPIGQSRQGVAHGFHNSSRSIHGRCEILRKRFECGPTKPPGPRLPTFGASGLGVEPARCRALIAACPERLGESDLVGLKTRPVAAERCQGAEDPVTDDEGQRQMGGSRSLPGRLASLGPSVMRGVREGVRR